MEFDDQSVDVGGVQDQRGSSAGRGGLGGMPMGAALGGGGGLVGIIVVVVVLLLGGGGLPTGAIDVNQATGGALGDTGAGGESLAALQERCNTEGAIDKYVDCRMIKVYNVINTTWAAEFATRGLDYRPPGLTFFSGAVNTGCGRATAAVGPFYCPPDQRMYFDLDFLQQLQNQYGAAGEFAQAYIEAHEAGHHRQTLLGTERQVRAAQQADPRQANALSVRMELQADCYAGVWSTLADQQESNGIILSRDDIQEAMSAAAAVGDDRIQKAAGQRVNPERWTHGSAEQRSQWFYTGYETGDLSRCDTFST